MGRLAEDISDMKDSEEHQRCPETDTQSLPLPRPFIMLETGDF